MILLAKSVDQTEVWLKSDNNKEKLTWSSAAIMTSLAVYEIRDENDDDKDNMAPFGCDKLAG